MVTLEINGQVVSWSDPSGGEFNAAGDVDRLLPFSPHLLLLGRIDPYGQVEFGPSEMAAIATRSEALRPSLRRVRKRRGLMRLQALAANGSRIPGSVLRWLGD